MFGFIKLVSVCVSLSVPVYKCIQINEIINGFVCVCVCVFYMKINENIGRFLFYPPTFHFFLFVWFFFCCCVLFQHDPKGYNFYTILWPYFGKCFLPVVGPRTISFALISFFVLSFVYDSLRVGGYIFGTCFFV